jgi:8-oxo-dGTP diphosphatase
MAVVRVAAAVILGTGGEVLLAQRPAGKAYAGYWEFPGGKLEPGESGHDALVRELREELGLEVVDAAPWLVQRYTYPHADVELNFFRVFAFTGEPFGHDGQAFRWQTPGRFDVAPLLPANTAILRALELPPVYGVIPAATLAAPSSPTILRRALDQRLELIRIDLVPGAATGERSAIERLVRLVAAAGVRVLLGGTEADARALGCAGVHWTATELRAATTRPADLLVGATCAHAADIAHAGALGLDFVELEWAATGAADAAAAARGWAEFAQAIAATAVPVFARGCLARTDLAFAQRQGAHGVALVIGAG